MKRKAHNALAGIGSTIGRTVEGGRKHAVSITVATVLSGLAGTFIPMLENHWNEQAQERQQLQAIEAAVAPLKIEIDNLKQTQQALWQAIGKKKDK